MAVLQDLLVYALQGLSIYAAEGRKVGVQDPKVNTFTVEALFSTLTNVNFDPERFVKMIDECVRLREALKEKVRKAGGKADHSEGPAIFKPDKQRDALLAQGADGRAEIRPVDKPRHSLVTAYRPLWS